MKAPERIAVALASVLVALGLYNGAHVMNDHLGTESFPAHAKFHAVLGGAYLVLLSALAAIVAWSPRLRRAGRGLLLGGVLLAIPAGFLGAVAVVPSGSPGGSYVMLALFGATLALVITLLLARTRPG